MSVEQRVELLTGVGAFVINRDGDGISFLGVQEETWKTRSNKLAKMWTFPMETVEDGETHHDAIKRLFREEVDVPSLRSKDQLLLDKLGIYQLSPGIFLHAYLFEAPDFGFVPGSHRDEVGLIRWINTSEVLATPANQFRFRPGVLEVVQDFLTRLASPGVYSPRIHYDLANRVPQQVFDLLEQGVSQAEALSRLGLCQEPQLVARV